MHTCLIAVLALALGQPAALEAGRHTRKLSVGGQTRSYVVHVPRSYDAGKPTPVVVALHGAAMNALLMEGFCGLSRKSEQAGFVVVYPEGTGPGGLLLTWNAGAFPGDLQKERPDDVAYVARVLDDLAALVNVDARRVYATGMSNGAMMAYRLAAELPERFAAIAPVAGVMVLERPEPKQPMPILHIHGTEDILVPFGGSKNGRGYRFLAVEKSLEPWLKVNGCEDKPAVSEVPGKADKLKVVRKEWACCATGAPVVLYVIEGGGHTWPGMNLHAPFLGATTYNISANDLMWEFFQKHARK